MRHLTDFKTTRMPSFSTCPDLWHFPFNASLFLPPQTVMRPLAKASTMMPPAAFRADPGVLITAFARYLPSILETGPTAAKLTGPFSKVRWSWKLAAPASTPTR